MSHIRYGIQDEDNLWMGTPEKPASYDDELLAKVAMTYLSVQYPSKTFRVVPFTEHGEMRDEIQAPMTLREAIKLAEGK